MDGAVGIDEIAKPPVARVIEMGTNLATECLSLLAISLGGGLVAQCLRHFCQRLQGFVIDAVGAKALDMMGLGIVQDIGRTDGGREDGGIVTRNAVVEDRRAREQSVLSIESITFPRLHGVLRCDVGLAQEAEVGGLLVIVPRGNDPNDVVPSLMTDAGTPVSSDTPKRVGSLFGHEQSSRVPGIDGNIARPLSAITAACLYQAVGGVALQR